MWNEKPPVKYWFFAMNCMVHEAQGIDSGVKPGCDFFYFVQNITLTFLHWLLISMSKIVVHVIGFFLNKIWSEKEWKVAEFDALIKPVDSDSVDNRSVTIKLSDVSEEKPWCLP